MKRRGHWDRRKDYAAKHRMAWVNEHDLELLRHALRLNERTLLELLCIAERTIHAMRVQLHIDLARVRSRLGRRNLLDAYRAYRRVYVAQARFAACWLRERRGGVRPRFSYIADQARLMSGFEGPDDQVRPT